MKSKGQIFSKKLGQVKNKTTDDSADQFGLQISKFFNYLKYLRHLKNSPVENWFLSFSIWRDKVFGSPYL